MRRLVLLCLVASSMTAAVAGAAPLLGRPAATMWFSSARNAHVTSRHRRVTHKKGHSGVVHTSRTIARAASETVLFGNESVESGRAYTFSGQPDAFPFTNSSTGSASSIAVYVASGTKATTLSAGLYADENGAPGSLLTTGSLSSPKSGTWNWITIHTTAVKPGTYWVVVLPEGGPLRFRARDDGNCSSQKNQSGHLATMPSSWLTGPQGNACPISGYVVGALSPAGSAGGGSGGTGTTESAIVLPPVNTGAPTISGGAVDGDTLTASNGTWADSPTSYAYQWQDCTPASLGLQCAAISGATASTYTLGRSDVGDTVRVLVTAANSTGSTSAASAQTGAVALPPPPADTAAPMVSGSPAQGQTLSTSNGVWSNNPKSYAYGWEDCDSSGNNCTSISNATGSNYTLTSGDVGHTIRSVVTAGNDGGSATASSGQTAVVTTTPPSNTAIPTVTGSAEQGQTLTTSNGSWSGSPTGYQYGWEDCDNSGNNCTSISDATGSTYTLTSGDVGHTIRSVVTVSNDGGSATASSGRTAVVTVPPPANSAVPTINGDAVEGQTLTTSDGSWTNGPTSFVYQWQDCEHFGRELLEHQRRDLQQLHPCGRRRR